MRYLENKESNKKIYTFRQNHSSGTINRRLHYIFISNELQEISNDTYIISAFKTNNFCFSYYFQLYIF